MRDRPTQRLLFGSAGNTLVMLIAVLAVTFSIFKFIQLAFMLTHSDASLASQLYEKNIQQWFVFPASIDLLIYRPWTLLTYIFFHDGVFHLIGNLIWLWVFGFILQDLTGNKSILPLFLYGGLAGALFFLLGFQVFPGLKMAAPVVRLEGASAGIMAIAMATTLLAPNYRFFPMIHGGIPLWVVTAIYIVIDIAMIAGMSNPGGHLSHLGGAVWGLIYMWQLQKGHDWGNGLNRLLSAFGQLFQPRSYSNTGKSKQEFFYRTSGKPPYQKTPHLTQQRIDAILDKIGEKGLSKLTEEEKAILKKAAEEDNL